MPSSKFTARRHNSTLRTAHSKCRDSVVTDLHLPILEKLRCTGGAHANWIATVPGTGWFANCQ